MSELRALHWIYNLHVSSVLGWNKEKSSYKHASRQKTHIFPSCTWVNMCLLTKHVIHLVLIVWTGVFCFSWVFRAHVRCLLAEKFLSLFLLFLHFIDFIDCIDFSLLFCFLVWLKNSHSSIHTSRFTFSGYYEQVFLQFLQNHVTFCERKWETDCPCSSRSLLINTLLIKHWWKRRINNITA